MKALFFLIYLALGTLAAWQGGVLYRSFTAPVPAAVPEPADPAGPGPDKTAASGNAAPMPAGGPGKNDRAGEQAIVARNLFRVLTDAPKTGLSDDTRTAAPVLEKTQLRLALWGTVAGPDPADCWAVIEDQSKRRQALYRVGDQVKGASIKSISRHRVILTLNGKDQVLEAQTKTTGQHLKAAPIDLSRAMATAAASPVKLSVAGELKPPEDLIRAMKTRPYLKNGKPAGLLLYGVRPNSGITALGLRNGDIIQTINGMPVAGPEDLSMAAGGLSSSPDLRISLMRRGRSQEVVYDGQTRAFTTQETRTGAPQ